MRFIGRYAALGATLGTLVFAASAGAATYKVTQKTDPVPGACTSDGCSLREAVQKANNHKGADKIVLPSKTGAYKLEVVSTGENGNADGDLDITDPVTITHTGKGRATVDGDDVDRVFDVFARTTFSNLVITNGEITVPDGEGDATEEGAGIRADASITVLNTKISKARNLFSYGGGIGLVDGNNDLVLKNSQIVGNVASTDGAAIDGASGKLKISRSTISGNRGGGNGAIYYYSGEPSSIVKSTISNNHMGSEESIGGGIYISGGKPMTRPHARRGGSAPSPLSVKGSTISKNSIDGSGGGIGIRGVATLNVTNSTFDGNKAAFDGGGIYDPFGKVTLKSSTVTRNVANTSGTPGNLVTGGGIFYSPLAVGFKVQSSIIALNKRGNQKNDCGGGDEFKSQGFNLMTKRCDGLDKPTDKVTNDPKLGTLGKHGGPTKTVALKASSPAVDNGSPQSPRRDQRGVKRDQDPDIGAFELK